MGESLNDTTHELGLRERVKADHSRWSVEKPMEAAFYAVIAVQGGHNLDNVRSLRGRYPDEWHKRMQESIAGEEHPGTFTHARIILKAIFDQDNPASVKQVCEEDALLGIPEEFIEIPNIREYMKTLANRSWTNQEVNAYLRDRFNLGA
ncbi:hypothetical protein KJ596_01820 [Patescibacteria group bacterium]|nr:hypothetical protein [Patescibacteria group bacterium]MBU1868203.1 hypothetical protein [Patescibacteria group bacterium]